MTSERATTKPISPAEMVARQLVARGIRDPRVLDAMAAVPRAAFVPEPIRDQAYADRALAVGYDQTISQPYVVAWMTEAAALEPTDRVLEIGTGTGYSAAVLSRLAGEVFSIERIPELATAARDRLAVLSYRGVEVACRDGSIGWPEHAPYQAILVTAAGPDLPSALVDQLAIGGRLVMPVGPRDQQRLTKVTRRSDGGLDKVTLGNVVFVPLIGEQAW